MDVEEKALIAFIGGFVLREPWPAACVLEYCFQFARRLTDLSAGETIEFLPVFFISTKLNFMPYTF
jgi:hypothetical protein